MAPPGQCDKYVCVPWPFGDRVGDNWGPRHLFIH